MRLPGRPARLPRWTSTPRKTSTPRSSFAPMARMAPRDATAARVSRLWGLSASNLPTVWSMTGMMTAGSSMYYVYVYVCVYIYIYYIYICDIIVNIWTLRGFNEWWMVWVCGCVFICICLLVEMNTTSLLDRKNDSQYLFPICQVIVSRFRDRFLLLIAFAPPQLASSLGLARPEHYARKKHN